MRFVGRWTFLGHNRAMLTRTDLSALLQGVNVKALSRESGVAEKTIYRLRHGDNAATLDTAEKLVAAIRRIRAVAPAESAA
jgi:hypothetical protein